MGMNTHVVAFRPPDEKWAKMKQIFDNCEELNIPPPEEVDEFFNNEPPDESGVLVRIPEAIEEYKGDMEEGFEVDLESIPDDIRFIRFYNSY